MKDKSILIIGATSAIAISVARIYAERGACLYLFARDHEKLDNLKSDLIVRGARKVITKIFNAQTTIFVEQQIKQAFEEFHCFDIALIAHGSLQNQLSLQASVENTLTELTLNGTSHIAYLTSLAEKFELQKAGTIAVITSVAGDRGKGSNYIYGSAKGMVSIFLQGLRVRLHPFGINVLDIKPGFVDTPMTKHFEKGILWTQPEFIAKCIVNAIESNKQVVYAPKYWRFIMLIIKAIPESIFKRLNL